MCVCVCVCVCVRASDVMTEGKTERKRVHLERGKGSRSSEEPGGYVHVSVELSIHAVFVHGDYCFYSFLLLLFLDWMKLSKSFHSFFCVLIIESKVHSFKPLSPSLNLIFLFEMPEFCDDSM